MTSPDHADSPAVGASSQQTPAGPLILNVNDSEAGRYATTRMLLKGGFTVLEAANGAAALELAAERPDLVLLDVKMPDMNGFEVCKRLKADPATAAIPVIFLSATYRDSGTVVEGLDTGADGYLTEPVESQVLLASVRAALRARAAEAAAAAALGKLKAVLAAVDAPVCLLDRHGVVEYASAAAHASVSPADGALEGRPCGALFGESLDDALATLRAALAPVEFTLGTSAARLTAIVDALGVYQGAVLSLHAS